MFLDYTCVSLLHVQDEVAEFLGGILSQGPMVQESIVVDLSDLDHRKQRRLQNDPLDDIDGHDFPSLVNTDFYCIIKINFCCMCL